MRMQFVMTALWLLIFLFVVNTAKTVTFATDLQSFDIYKQIILSCKASILANFWVFVITQQDMLFGWFRNFCFSLVDSYSWNGKQIDKNKKANAEYLLKPFLTCEKCTTGNLAFWFYIFQCKGNIVILDLLFIISFSTLITISTTKKWQS